eukprot:Seg4947.2 transcript_id=Seg4947.2/GoldUCD/mRNA.D3Y31 product="hypothetical protein" protein_id=Seg4947.2/GoldUCD/D3Y31
MYPGFSSVINLSVEDLSQGEFILIEDNQTDGSFLLHHFIAAYLKAGANICLVGFSQTLVHYASIGKKLGLNLNAARENNQLTFIDGMSLFLECLEDQDPSGETNQPIDLKRFHQTLKSTVSDKVTLLIFDDITSLVNSGVSAETVADFMHYCYSMAVSPNNKLCLLALMHCDLDIDDEATIFLRNQLKYHVTISINVKGLTTGYSRDVHGQVEVKRRDPQGSNTQTETKIMQYKLNDKGVDFFPLGTSAAVL